MGNLMKTKQKAAGFFIVEVLIVLVLLAILTLIFLPNLQQYVDRAKFMDNIRAANSVKAAVELCALSKTNGVSDGTAPNDPFAGCTQGTRGIYTPPIPYGGHVHQLNINSGIITTLSTYEFGPDGVTPYLYTLTPTASNGVITWTAGGNCAVNGLC